jgi:hypothetical protein
MPELSRFFGCTPQNWRRLGKQCRTAKHPRRLSPWSEPMIPRVTEARYAGSYRVWLRFADGLSGEVDLERELWGPIFVPLKDLAEFAKVRCEPELGTIIWPNGADFAPEFLYDELKAALSSANAAE